MARAHSKITSWESKVWLENIVFETIRKWRVKIYQWEWIIVGSTMEESLRNREKIKVRTSLEITKRAERGLGERAKIKRRKNQEWKVRKWQKTEVIKRRTTKTC